MAPNKATLAFQDERQVYRRKFMRAELQRVGLGICAKDGGRESERCGKGRMSARARARERE